MTVLSRDSLKALGDKLISPFEDDLVQGASYDLQIGDQCEIEGELKILTSELPAIEIAPGAFAILTTREILKLPKNMVGRAGLLSKYALLGLNSTIGPQIDPGFEGLLTIPLVNMGNSTITLRRGDPFLTIEFSELDRAVQVVFSELHGPIRKMRRETIVSVKARPDFRLLATVEQDMRDLKAKVEEMERTTNNILFAMLVAILGGTFAGLVVVIVMRILN